MKNKRLLPFFLTIFKSLIILFFSTSCGLFYYDEYSFNPGDMTANGTVYRHDDNYFDVIEVIDGDTFSINTGDTVRILGINTPEIDRYYYEEARDILGVMISGEQVRLEKDITDRDNYGRLLRYVYIGDLSINLEMVKKGFANVYTLGPDVRYAEDFLEAERYARENKLGLWVETENQLDIRVSLKFDAAGNDRENLNGEYLILINTANSDYNIEGWTVKDSGTNIYEFERYLFINGTEISLFSGSGQDGNGIFYWNNKSPIWNNDHDSLYLRDREGLLIEFLEYKNPD